MVGVLGTKGSTGITDPNDVAIVPYTTAQDLLTGYSNNFSSIIVQAKSSSRVNAAEQEAADILASANQTSVANLPFSVLNESTLLATSASTNSTFTVLLGAVAAISLLVGGIGIMNIMLVTVTERTREIGIRKAIGAPRRAILGQFLTEAMLLSFFGGLAGVIVGLIGSRFKIVGVKPLATPGSIVLAFVVAVAVGVFFGFYPANRAAGLSPSTPFDTSNHREVPRCHSPNPRCPSLTRWTVRPRAKPRAATTRPIPTKPPIPRS